LAGFLSFKRARGYQYKRAEFMLHSFDRFLSLLARKKRTWRLDQAIFAWLADRPDRKAISVAMDLSVLREFWRYLHRLDSHRYAREPRWPILPTEPRFVAHILTKQQIHSLLGLITQLDRPLFRSALYRALFLVLYCSGLRIGEALRLRVQDVDFVRRAFYILESKGRSRWVPFHPSLQGELQRYLQARRAFVGEVARSDARLFVSHNRQRLPISTASGTFAGLYRAAGLKPAHGRDGPRLHDLRHSFAVHRLTRWYREGADLHSRLPWLSTYMGHVDLLGTETYLTTTPELLGLAGKRFGNHFRRKRSS